MISTGMKQVLATILLLWSQVAKADHCDATPSDNDDIASETQTLGPYFISDVPYKGYSFAPPDRQDGEERITVSGYVLDTDCNHIPCAELEIWGTDPVGGYSFYEPFWGRGRIQTDENGFYQFETWWPTYYPDGIFPFLIPHHLHYVVTAMGQTKSFITQMYFDFDPRAEGSGGVGVGSSFPDSLKATRVQAANGVDWEVCFNVVLENVASSSLVVPAAGCSTDTGTSRTMEGTMTDTERAEAHALQGSTIGMGDTVAVTDPANRIDVCDATNVPTTTPSEATSITTLASTFFVLAASIAALHFAA